MIKYMTRERIVGSIIVVLAAIIAYTLTQMKKPVARRPSRPAQFMVAAQYAQWDYHQPEFVLLGRVQSPSHSDLIPEVSGLVLTTDFRLLPGTTFKRGQVLMRLDDRQAKLQFRMQTSELLQALVSILPDLEAQFPLSYANWKNFAEGLDFNNLPKMPEFASEREKLFLSRFQIPRLYFMLEQSWLQLEKYTLKAPFTGAVDAVNLAPGAMARTGVATARLLNTSSLEVELSIPLLVAEQMDDHSKFYLERNQTYSPLELRRLNPAIDERTQTRWAYFSSNIDDLRVGESVRVQMQFLMKQPTLKLPATAVHNGNTIWVLTDNRIQSHPVKVLLETNEFIFLSEGPPAGVPISLQTLDDFVEGTKVEFTTPILETDVIGGL
jgi:membrane fusion protein, multidrug efflux system